MADELKIKATVETSEFQKLKIALDQIDYGVRKGNITLAQATVQYNKLTHEMVGLSTSGKLTEVQINSLDKALFHAGKKSLFGFETLHQTINNLGKSGVGAMNQMQHSMNQAVMPMMSLNYIIQDMPFGLRGIANNIQMLPQQMMMLAQSTGGWGNALTALKGTLSGPLGIVFGISAVTSLMQMLPNLFSSNKKEVADLTEEIRKLNIELGITSSDQALAEVNRKIDEMTAKLAKLKEGNPPGFWSLAADDMAKFWKNYAIGADIAYEKIYKLLDIKTIKSDLGKMLGGGSFSLFPFQPNKTDDAAIAEAEKGRLLLFKEKKELSMADLDLAGRAVKLNLLSGEEYRGMLETSLQTVKVKKDEYTIREKLQVLNKEALKDEEAFKKFTIDRLEILYGKGAGAVNFGAGEQPKIGLLSSDRLNQAVVPHKGITNWFYPAIDELKEAKKVLKDFDLPLDALRSGFVSAFDNMYESVNRWIDGLKLGNTFFGNLVSGVIRGVSQMMEKFASMAAISGLLSLIPGLGTFGSFMTALGGGGIMDLFKKGTSVNHGGVGPDNRASLNNFQGNFAQRQTVIVVGGTLRANRGEFYAEMRNEHVIDRSRGGGW